MTSSRDLLQRQLDLIDRAIPFVCVTLIDALGSTPQDAGNTMTVTAEGLDLGTVGGGRLEAKAIDEARSMIASGLSTRLCDWSLKGDVGMTCGGRVKLFFQLFNRGAWKIVIFGAGHVSQALSRLLLTLPCQVTCIDPRRQWLDKLPEGVVAVESQSPEALVGELDPRTFILCMTRGHQSDFPVLREIYASDKPFPFVGVIGSRAKAAVLRKELAAAGIDPPRIAFHCPVGLPIGSNHPSEIAISIAAQLLEIRDRVGRNK